VADLEDSAHVEGEVAHDRELTQGQQLGHLMEGALGLGNMTYRSGATVPRMGRSEAKMGEVGVGVGRIGRVVVRQRP